MSCERRPYRLVFGQRRDLLWPAPWMHRVVLGGKPVERVPRVVRGHSNATAPVSSVASGRLSNGCVGVVIPTTVNSPCAPVNDRNRLVLVRKSHARQLMYQFG